MFQYYFFAKSDLDLSIVFFLFVFFAKYYVLSNHNNLGQEGGRAGIKKNVTDTFRHLRGVTTDLGGGQGRNTQKRHLRGVTTDLYTKTSLTRGHN